MKDKADKKLKTLISKTLTLISSTVKKTDTYNKVYYVIYASALAVYFLSGPMHYNR
jgi:hypothetical protein